MTIPEPEAIAIASTIIGVLAATVAALWKWNLAAQNRERERLEHCEKMHKNSQEQVVELTAQYHELKGRMEGVESLSHSVIREIRDTKG